MEAIAKARNLPISFKSSLILCKQMKGLSLEKAKNLLNCLLEEKISINGKFYKKCAEKFLEVLNQAEANAKQKNMKNLFVKKIKADKGEKILRLKRKGIRSAKSVNLEITLIEK